MTCFRRSPRIPATLGASPGPATYPICRFASARSGGRNADIRGPRKQIILIISPVAVVSTINALLLRSTHTLQRTTPNLAVICTNCPEKCTGFCTAILRRQRIKRNKRTPRPRMFSNLRPVSNVRTGGGERVLPEEPFFRLACAKSLNQSNGTPPVDQWFACGVLPLAGGRVFVS